MLDWIRSRFGAHRGSQRDADVRTQLRTNLGDIEPFATAQNENASLNGRSAT